MPAAGRAAMRWQVLVTEAVAGRLPQPWTDVDLEAVHDACLRVAEALTPSPPGLDVGTLADAFAGDAQVTDCFRRLLDGTLRLTGGQPDWVLDRSRQLQHLVDTAAGALVGTTGCHGDLRADNVLVDGTRATLVDWNWLRPGPAWADLVGVLPLARADGLDAEAWLRRSPLTRDVDPDHVDAWLATVAAYMLANADQPVWPGGPASVRVHQRRYARTFLDWLGARRGWDAR
ncbi:hypothetical protein GCM10028814_01620 [Angustibacter aerolatus]